jgi:pimeloyl-ACP methyl ester carboxylesterase
MIRETGRRWMSFLLLIGLGYLGLCLLLFVVQRSLIYYPPPRTRSPEGIERLTVNGTTLAVAVRPLRGPRALLYFGGNAEDVAWSLPELGAAYPSHALYLLYYRGYGESEGRPTEAGLHADAEALFDRVHAEQPEVVVVGRSLGSAVALRLATRRPVSRLVLITPFDSLAGVGRRAFPIFPVRWLLRDRYESWRWAPAVTAPTHLITAERDEIVPSACTKRLLEAFPPGVATLTVVAGVDHNSISASPDYLAALRTGP